MFRYGAEKQSMGNEQYDLGPRPGTEANYIAGTHCQVQEYQMGPFFESLYQLNNSMDTMYTIAVSELGSKGRVAFCRRMLCWTRSVK